MAALSTTHVIEIETGIAEPASISLTVGEELPPLSIGKKGNWHVDAGGVLDVHAFMYFDGSTLFIQSAEEEVSVTVDGYRVGKAWTELHAPCEIEVGSARFRFRSVEEDEEELTSERRAAAKPSVPAPTPPPKPARPFRPGELATGGDVEDETATRALPAPSSAGSGSIRPAAGRPTDDETRMEGTGGSGRRERTEAFASPPVSAPANPGTARQASVPPPGATPRGRPTGPHMPPGMLPPGVIPPGMPGIGYNAPPTALSPGIPRPASMPPPGMHGTAPGVHPAPMQHGSIPPGMAPPMQQHGSIPPGMMQQHGSIPPGMMQQPMQQHGSIPPGMAATLPAAPPMYGHPSQPTPGNPRGSGPYAAAPRMTAGGYGSMTGGQVGAPPPEGGIGYYFARYNELSLPKRILVILAPFCMLASGYLILFDDPMSARSKARATADAGVVATAAPPPSQPAPAITPSAAASAQTSCPPGFVPYTMVPNAPVTCIPAGTHMPGTDAGAPAPATPTDGGAPKTLERQAVDFVAANDYAHAAQVYEQLQQQNPQNRVYAEAARILRAKANAVPK